ncbi:mechanosensitive ion channel domain-containing protein [Halarcobacter sp.]|uniref:mechanosensitive ion channel domain-containing protein n=1 Tax=Halarcobacter sp. TaxID=2321133 RepID=UPI0029F55477|nr:mechanosensitive ion channel domain-containing protein [Halarcobacter sp.]
MHKFLKIFILYFFIPCYLFSAQTLFTGNLEKAKEEIQSTQENLDEQSIDQKVNEQIKIAQNVIKNINEEVYLLKEFQNKDYSTRINYLENRISLNQKEDNNLAIKRDQIELQLLRQEAFYESTLKDLVESRRSFKDIEYFEEVLNTNIQYLLKNNFDKFRAIYENEKNNENKISKELTDNYLKLANQYIQQLFTLRYLKENIDQYRTTNFFIDNFNLQYVISIIDSNKFISSISKFTSYHFKMTIGEIVIVLLVLLFFKLFVTKVITIFISLLNRIFIQNYNRDEDEEEENKEILEYIENSIRKPLVIALYTLSIHISLYILVKDTLLLNKVVPWINTLYIGLLTWAIYALLSNSITSFAQHLVEKYPNVRREMIVFILRILKVIFILLVILFLFTQLGIDIKAIAASLGVGGIAIALASKDTLANFFGSLNIMSDNSFSQGDWILANDVEGTVVDIRMRTTRIRTFDNAMITIPNSELANTHIKNYSKRRIGRRIKMTLNITYESSIDDIYNLKKDIHEMLINHSGIASERTIKERRTRRFEAIKREDLNGVKRNLMVYIDEYGSSSINIFIYCFSRSPDWEDWLEVKEDVIMRINKLVKENNCDFAYPTQTLFMKKD